MPPHMHRSITQFIVYPSISNGVFSTFYCVGLEDGTSWLRVDLSIQCTDTSRATTTTHAIMQAYTVIMIVVHVIGTPATYIYLLFWKHTGALEALAEQEKNDEHKAGLEQTVKYEVLLKTDEPRLDKSAVLPGYIQKLCGGYRLRVCEKYASQPASDKAPPRQYLPSPHVLCPAAQVASPPCLCDSSCLAHTRRLVRAL